MSYPYPGGPNNHPYPPSLSYPSAPPLDNAPYPTQPSYPPGGYPSPYPVNPTPYPTSQPGYPPSQPGYPPSQPGYPPSQPGYPPSQPGYPPSQPGYPTSQPGFPSSQPGYPPSQPGYPPAPYPTSSQPLYPSSTQPPYSQPHAPHAGGYPSNDLYPNLAHQPPANSGNSGHLVTKGHPTVRPANPFVPRQDAEILRKAMKGIGTDEAAIIAVLSKRTNAQRQEIAREFKTLFGKDLVKDLKSETSGKLEQLLVALMTPVYEFYADEIKHAISGIGTNESTLIEVLCGVSNADLYYIKTTYEKKFGSSMESDLRSDTSGNFKRLLTSLCVGRRDESPAVDFASAERDAQALHQAGELRFGTDESTFNAILCSRSFPQLQAIFSQYERISGNPFEKAVKKEFSGDIEDGLLAIVKCVQNKPRFFAECLHKSMAGAGTNDRALIRLIVTRSENDLEDVKREYVAKYGKSLEAAIKGDTSGDYKKLLIALLG